MAEFPHCAMPTCSLFHDQMYSSWKLDYVRQVIVLRLEILAWHSTLCTVWKIKNFTATVILREIVLCIFWTPTFQVWSLLIQCDWFYVKLHRVTNFLHFHNVEYLVLIIVKLCSTCMYTKKIIGKNQYRVFDTILIRIINSFLRL